MNYDENFLGGWDQPVPGERKRTEPQPAKPEDIDAPQLVDEEPEYQLDSSDDIEEPDAAPEEEDAGDPVGNFVPADTADRPVDPNMRARFAGHGELNDLVRGDWIAAIELDADAFDALLYRAYIHQPETADGTHTPQVADLYDPNQALLDYQPPVPVVMLDCPDEMESFTAMYDNSDNTGAGVDALILRTTGINVPVGSVFEWQEQLTDDRYRRCWWYVQRIFNYGTASVGSLFYCVPFRSMEGIEHAE